MKRIFVFLLTALFTIGYAHAQTIKGTFAIKNEQTGIYLRIKDANKKNGTPIVAYSPVNWKCVTWDFKQVSDNTYQLSNLFSNKTLQPVTGTAEAGTALEEQPLISDNSIQLYEFISAGKGLYLIRLKGTELYITPSDSEGTINSPIILAKKMVGKLQQWSLHEQPPEI